MKIWELWTKRRSGEEEIYRKLESFLSTHNADIVSFAYYSKIFGNIIVAVDHDGSIYEFVTDRGEIWCNDSFICDSSYHRAGQRDTVDQLISVMKRIFENDSMTDNEKT